MDVHGKEISALVVVALESGDDGQVRRVDAHLRKIQDVREGQIC